MDNYREQYPFSLSEPPAPSRIGACAGPNKVRFLHLNHTNPALDPESEATRAIKKAGHHVARQGEQVEL